MSIWVKFTCISPPAHFLLFVLKGGFLGTFNSQRFNARTIVSSSFHHSDWWKFSHTYWHIPSSQLLQHQPVFRHHEDGGSVFIRDVGAYLYYMLWKPSKKASITWSAGFLIVNVLWCYKFIPSRVYYSLTLLISLLIFSLGNRQDSGKETLSATSDLGNLVSMDLNCNNKKDHSKYHCYPY